MSLTGHRDGYYDEAGVWQRTKFCLTDCGEDCTCKPPFSKSPFNTKEPILGMKELLQQRNPINWVEDFEGKNGMSDNDCYVCRHDFKGFKGRVVCKRCANKHLEYVEEEDD